MKRKTGKKSESPEGVTMPNALHRLKEIKEKNRRKDAEHIMVHLWAQENVRDPLINFGLVPLDQILHECTEECGKVSRLALTKGLHRYNRKFSTRDTRIVAATVQWLATNVGRCFLREFLRKLESANKPELQQNPTQD